MNKTKYLLALAALLAVSPAHAGVKKIGNINGIDIYRVKTFSVFCPSTTTLVGADPKQPGTLVTLNAAAGPGLVPAAANAGGLAGAAALLRPNRSETNVNGGNTVVNGGNTAVNGGNNVGSPGWIPPGHR